MTAMMAAFLAGVLFAIGLGIGGMTQPTKVIGFLDVAGRWDPSLAFVMMSAVAVYGALFRLVRRRARPMLAPIFSVPTHRHVDRRLVLGAGLFGMGWGLAGYCPGPAIVSLTTATTPVVAFVTAMLVGMSIADVVAGTWMAAAPARSSARLTVKERTT